MWNLHRRPVLLERPGTTCRRRTYDPLRAMRDGDLRATAWAAPPTAAHSLYSLLRRCEPRDVLYANELHSTRPRRPHGFSGRRYSSDTESPPFAPVAGLFDPAERQVDRSDDAPAVGHLQAPRSGPRRVSRLVQHDPGLTISSTVRFVGKGGANRLPPAHRSSPAKSGYELTSPSRYARAGCLRRARGRCAQNDLRRKN
jgi:hypothetical protein